MSDFGMQLFMAQQTEEAFRSKSPITPRQRPLEIRTGTISANLPYDSPQQHETQNDNTLPILIIVCILLYILFFAFLYWGWLNGFVKGRGEE